MNLFWLDEDPFKSIEYHCDKHIVKMPTEYKQMLSTAHRVLDGEMYYDITARGHRIKRWKLKESLRITLKNRPDLIKSKDLSDLEIELLNEIKDE